MQNGATNVDITFENNKIIVEDNGIGSDHVKDSSNMNGFEKYFVFGNSYQTATEILLHLVIWESVVKLPMTSYQIVQMYIGQLKPKINTESF